MALAQKYLGTVDLDYYEEDLKRALSSVSVIEHSRVINYLISCISYALIADTRIIDFSFGVLRMNEDE